MALIQQQLGLAAAAGLLVLFSHLVATSTLWRVEASHEIIAEGGTASPNKYSFDSLSLIKGDSGADGGSIKYEYRDGELGPANWGSLQPDWRLCKEGDMQSPIALDNAAALQNQTLVLATFYNSAIVDLISDRGPTLVWRGGGGSLYFNTNGPYRVVEMHWHTLSEHTVDGTRFPLEVHIVHEGPNKEILVVGIPYMLGNDDPFIQFVMLWKINPQIVRLANIKSDYFNYMGSLTTPPCKEDVTWVLRDTILQVSQRQLDFFLSTIGGPNSRPLQPLNGRIVYKHQESL